MCGRTFTRMLVGLKPVWIFQALFIGSFFVALVRLHATREELYALQHTCSSYRNVTELTSHDLPDTPAHDFKSNYNNTTTILRYPIGASFNYSLDGALTRLGRQIFIITPTYQV